ncbi:hypothetical protein [Pseudomonas sp. PB106]|uniref:hypothetical protein n=1 Tax=Pseudomonas sp. PB106 TaxID=2494699 RepID=UPI00131A6D15|nr:hypothetical protein [Pseudomonas sp. PB106]KAE9650142.1 hypothetical protein EJA71_01820 [Pseudomonas sp. PB106]
MTASVTSDNSVFVLYPPRVSGQTQPVVGAHVGVPIVAYDLVTDGAGAYVEVDPPLSGTLIPGDEIKLWLKGESVLLSFVDIVDPNATILLRIPRGRLHPDRINELFYTIERNSQNIAESVVLAIVYNRIRPGLRDRMDVPGGHSELKLQLPDAIKNGVGPDFVSAQVCVSYPYCRAYDRITLSCNGELLHANVGAGQAPQPPNPGSEVPITVCFTVTRAYLDKAKRLDKKLDFRFTVTDQIGNGPDTNEPWSPLHSVDEDLDGTRLPMPILLERMEDFPGDDASIIDLGKLAGGPLLVVVVTSDNRFQVGDKVEATYTAKLAGQPDVVVTVSGTVEGDPFGVKQTCFLRVPNDKIVANSDVAVSYQLSKPNGDPVGSSTTANAKVTGEAAPDLKAPSIKEASGSSLDPLAALNSLTAVVNSPALRVGDIITATWAGAAGTAAGGSHTAPPKTVQVIGAQEIALPVSVLAFNLGKTVTVSYTVIRSGKTISSPPFTLNVQSLPQSVLVKPTIIQAANNGEGAELDVSSLTSATSRMGVWPLMALGQPVWMTATGTNADGSPYRKVIWTPPAATSANWIRDKFASAGIALAELRNLKHGSALSLQFKAGLGGSKVESEAVVFPVRTYAVIAVEDVKPTIASLKGLPGNVEIPDGSSTFATTVILSGKASNGQIVQVLDGTTDKGRPVVDLATGIWTLTVTDLSVAEHSFTVKALYGTGQTSAERILTVAAMVIPTITSLVTSPRNDHIPSGGTTGDTTVTLTGKAANGQKVQVLDGTVEKGQPIAHATTGIWTQVITGLSPTRHDFTAKAVYGTEAPSAVWMVTVVALAPMRPPVITHARATYSGIPIYPGETVQERVAVTYFGTCTPRPYTRQLYVHAVGGGGYGALVLPNSTTWENPTIYTHLKTVNAQATDEGLVSNIFTHHWR